MTEHESQPRTLHEVTVTVNGVRRYGHRARPGGCSRTSCATTCASPAPTSAASTASAAPAPSSSTAHRCARA